MQAPKLFGLLGRDISYSLSPFVFNSVFKRMRLPYLYLPFDIDDEDLGKFVDYARLFGISGFNVTIPYKERIVKFMDELDSSARSVGAVNLVKNKSGKLKGYNADLYGIKATVERHLKAQLKNRRVVLVGAGGAARAAIEYLRLKRPEKVFLFNRTLRKARKIAERLEDRVGLEVLPLTRLEDKLRERGTYMLINATPKSTASLLGGIPTGLRIFDMSYRRGASPYGGSRLCCDGRYMLAAQASRSLSLLCGLDEPAEKVFKALARR